MKLKALVLAIILALSTVVGVQFVELATANFLPTTKQLPAPDVPPPKPPTITVSSPKNQTYNLKSILFNFSVIVPQAFLELTKVYYYVDGEKHNSYLTPNWTMNLYGLSEGTHRVQVLASCRSFEFYNSSVTVDYYGTHYETRVAYSQEATSSIEVYFTVNYPPSIEILSPENRTYDLLDFPLDFVVNEPFSQLAYCLDGHDNMTIDGNSTLTNLPDGEHNITVYAWDTEGNVGASETLMFTVAKPVVFPPTLIASVSGALVAILCVGFWVFFKKGKAGIK
jgi:hypothetical protein